MFRSNQFGHGRAFWRWVVTADAEPYVAAFIERQRSSDTDQSFAPSGGFADQPDGILATTDFTDFTDSPPTSRAATARPTRRAERKPPASACMVLR